MGAPNYITDNKGNIVYPRTLAKCVKKGGTTLDDYLDKVEDNLLIKPTESGTEMMLTDSSDINIQELHLYGKTEQASTTGGNLFDINDRLSFNSIFKVDEEGYITATIPANNTEDYQYYNFFTKKSNLVKANTNYLIICEVVKMPTTKCSIRLTSVDKSTPGQIDGNVTISGKASGLEINLMKTKSDMSDSESFTRGYFSTSPGFTENQIKFRISVLEDTTITADTFKYEPYTGGMPSPNPDYPQEIVSVENPTISVAGKNKAKEYKVNKTDKPYTTILSIDADLEANKEYSLSFIAPKGLWFYFNENLFAYDLKQATGKYQTVKLKTVATLSKNNANQFDKSLQKWIILKTDAKNTVVADFEKVQLEKGNVGTEYEEYKPLQTATLNYELNAIDDVKDELVVKSDGTGQFVRRIKSYDCSQISRNLQLSPNSEYYYLPLIDKATTNASRVLSTHFTSKTFDKKWGNVFKVNGSFYFGEKEAPDNISDKNAMKQWLIGNKVKILFQLEEPIVTELSSEEVQKILALHTNKPNTTIWNDQDAEMQVTYVADTKTYIDNKLKELNDAIVASINKE